MWWQEAVVYQIYPRSFADADGRRRRRSRRAAPAPRPPAWLGVDAVWLSPFYPVADGRLRLRRRRLLRRRPALRRPGRLRRAARRGPRARDPGRGRLGARTTPPTSTRGSSGRAARDDPSATGTSGATARAGGGPPNNWPAAFDGGPAWTWDEATEQWYLHQFLPRAARPQLGQPASRRGDARRAALLARPRASTASASTSSTASARTRRSPTTRADLVGSHLDVVGTHDSPSTHALLRGIRDVLDEYPATGC